MALLKKKQANSEAAPKPKRSAKLRKGSGPGKAAMKRGNSGRRFVLIIGDDGAILVYMHGVKVVRRLFAPSPQASHTEAMQEIMQTNPRVPLYVLVDVMDQQYVAQTFPPVSALSVGGLVKRRLNRDFQPEDMKGALPLGRDKAGRKEWKFLLVALAKTPLITDWLDMLVELPNMLKGIFLVPIEAVNYVAMLNKKLGNDKPQPWQLLISYNKVSGFRQVVIHEGRLVFTRVSQAIDEAIPAVIAGSVEQEIINTMEYLKRLGFQENNELDATVILSQDVADSLDLGRFGFGQARALSPLKVAEALGLEQAALTADRFGDVVMAAAFGISKKHVLRFATAYAEKLLKLYQAQLALKAAGALISLVFLGLTLATFVDIFGFYSAIGEAKQKTLQLQSQLVDQRKAVDGLNKDLAFKSAVVAAYDSYIKGAPKPEDFVRSMMPFTTPQHRIVSVEWNYTEATGKPGQAASGAGGAVLPLEVKIEVDFAGSGGDAETLNKSAGDLLDEMKAKLLEFEVTNEPYLWNKEDKKEEAIAVELSQIVTLAPKDMVATFKLRGLKKVPAGGAVGAKAPLLGKVGAL